MLPAKVKQLLNGAIDHAIRQSSVQVEKEARSVVFNMADKGLSISTAAEQKLMQVHVEAMERIANQAWSEMKRVLQEVCVQPYAALENDLLLILKPKLLLIKEVVTKNFQRHRSPHYTFQDQLPKLEICLKQLESKFSNEVAIFSAGLEAKKLDKETNPMSSHITYNLHGDNPRININSQDYSINVTNSKIVFDEIRKTIESDIKDGNLKRSLQTKVTEMEESVGQKSFLQKYSEFIALAANHVTVFAPFLPALTQFLTQSGV